MAGAESKRILIVDNDSYQLSQMCRAMGVECLVCETCELGLRSFIRIVGDGKSFDLIFVSLSLPD